MIDLIVHFCVTMLYVKKSKLPNAGKGLYTSAEIKKSDVVCEYEGEKVTWKECLKRNENQKEFGAYYFYVNANNCIDAQHTLWSIARYANDAAGFGRVDGLRNNCKYEVRKGKPFIVSTRNLKPGDEIFVAYGKEYWDAIRESFEKKRNAKKQNAIQY